MAEEKKPTTRRKPAAKKSTPRKAAVKPSPRNEGPTEDQARTLRDNVVAQQRAKLETYAALKEQGLPIPEDLRREVEATLPAQENPQLYVRNTSYTMFRFKLARHTPQQRGVVLQARGTRGDLAPVTDEDLKDPILTSNLNSRYLELLTHEEAQEVVSKQTTNQQAVHPAMAALRNELGKPYEAGAVSMGPSPDEQAITVAHLDDGQIGFDRGGIANRVRGEMPGTPEYVVGAEPQHRPANEDPAFLSDLRARQRGHNPAGELKVSVDPPVKTGGNPKIISDGFNPER